MITLSEICGDPNAELTCNDDSCPCADGGCGGDDYAPKVRSFGVAGVPIYIYLGGYSTLNAGEDNSGVLTSLLDTPF